MKIINKIKNIIFLYRANKDISKVKSDAEYLIKFVQKWNKTKNSLERNLSCSIIKQLRLQNPYKVIDYSKAKELYDTTTPIDLSLITKDRYVYKFSNNSPVKGKRYCEYFISQNFSELGVYKVVEFEDNYEQWCLETHNEKLYYGLGDNDERSFRFTTKEEILEFKNRQKKFKQIKKEIEVKQEEISKLYKEL